jgi:Putative prokaryotic signal transducing protein
MAEPDNTQPRPNRRTNRRPNPNEKLVKVFDSEQEPEALVVKGLLDSAGIDSDLTSASLVQDAFPGLGGMILLVREEDAEAATRLIAEQRQAFSGQSFSAQSSSGQSSSAESALDDDTTSEIAIIEEPPPKG